MQKRLYVAAYMQLCPGSLLLYIPQNLPLISAGGAFVYIRSSDRRYGVAHTDYIRARLYLRFSEQLCLLKAQVQKVFQKIAAVKSVHQKLVYAAQVRRFSKTALYPAHYGYAACRFSASRCARICSFTCSNGIFSAACLLSRRMM